MKGALITWGIVAVIGLSVGGWLWPYTIETWATYLGRPDVDVKFWQGMVLGIIPYLGAATIPAAAVTWVSTWFIGGEK
jgi:hypothetical protein